MKRKLYKILRCVIKTVIVKESFVLIINIIITSYFCDNNVEVCYFSLLHNIFIMFVMVKSKFVTSIYYKHVFHVCNDKTEVCYLLI